MRLFCLFLPLGPTPTQAFPSFSIHAKDGVTGDAGQFLGQRVGPAGDVNGDGYADVVVGMPTTAAHSGSIEVYLGNGVAVDPNPIFEYELDLPTARLGEVVTAAGDVDGDGFGDIAVGCPHYYNGEFNEGAIFIFRGQPGGVVDTPWILEGDEEGAQLGTSVSWVGDANGDGYDEIMTGAPYWGGFGSPVYVPVQGNARVYYGSPSGPQTSGAWSLLGGQEDMEYGAAVAGLGDVNGDGYNDVAVGAPRWDPSSIDTDHGRVYCYLGSGSGISATASWDYPGEGPGYFVGESLARAGDLNGDGYADLVMSAPSRDLFYDGWMYVFHGGSAGLQSSPVFSGGGDSISQHLGKVRTGGDVNGDGFADVLVAGSQSQWIYLGSSSVAQLVELEPDTGTDWYDDVGLAGDLNEDGRSDLALGDSSWLDDSGAVWLYLMMHGPPTSAGSGQYHWARSDGPFMDPDGFFGTGVSVGGDVNGDGFDDLVLGARGSDTQAIDAGHVELYLGNADGLHTSDPDWLYSGTAPGGNLGFSVDTAGDVNGDGYADIVVGEPGADRIHAFHGGPTGPSALPDWTHTFEVPGTWFGQFVAGAGDVNGDGYADVIAGSPYYDGGMTDQGVVRVFFGSSGGLTGFDTILSLVDQSEFGRDGDGADLNGDGYSDLAVGVPRRNNGDVWVYDGGPDGVNMTPRTHPGPSYADGLGWSVSSIGDLFGIRGPVGEATEDLIVGMPFSELVSDNSGGVFTLVGSPSSAHFLWQDFTGEFGSLFGWSTETAGDWNLDTLSDFVVGGPGGRRITLAGMDRLSLNLLEYWHETTPKTPGSCCAGFAVSGGGDLNGDGIPDYAVGAGFPWDDDPSLPDETKGGVHVYYGTSDATLSLPYHVRQTTTAGEPIALGGLVPNAGQDVRLSIRGRTAAGSARVRAEAMVSPVGVPFQSTSSTGWVSVGPGGQSPTFQLDFTLSPETDYRWTMRVVNDDPLFPGSPWLTNLPAGRYTKHFRTGAGMLAVQPGTVVSTGPRFRRVWPNPSPGRSHVSFFTPETGPVDLDVFDVAGRRVARLVQGNLTAGHHHASWNGRDRSGQPVAHGVYQLRLLTPDQVVTTRILVVR